MITTHADKAEMAVLGACMREAACVPEVLSSLTADIYRKPEHGALHDLIRARHREGLGVDAVSLPEAVMRTGKADDFGGLDYLMQLEQIGAGVASLPTYIRDVIEASKRRKLRLLSAKMVDALETGKTSASIVRALSLRLQEIAVDGDRGPQGLGEVAVGVAEEIEAVIAGTVAPPLSTGLQDLDVGLGGGLRRGELVVVGARPGMGKTALAVGFAADAAAAGRSVLV